MLHDILSTSASFIVNTDDKSKPSYRDLSEDIQHAVNGKTWNTLYSNLDSSEEYADNLKESKKQKKREHGSQEAQGQVELSKEYFEKLYRSFELSALQNGTVSHSLAFTLANFGYDVWLPNLRGNYYSEGHAGRYHIERQDYWDFDLDTLIQEDLPSIVKFIEKKIDTKRVGIISYSHSVALVLGLLTKYPKYQHTLQPVILMAPALGTGNRGFAQKWTTRLVGRVLMSSNGAYPPVMSGLEASLCKSIITRSVCHYMNVLFGDGINPRIWTKKTTLISQNKECGRTSKRLLHQLIDNLASLAVKPKFTPWIRSRTWKSKDDSVIVDIKIKSLMVIHSKNDDVSTMEEVERILNTSMKGMLLLDHVIHSHSFDHRDFIYGSKNSYFVNGNILKMVALFEWLQDRIK